MESGKRRRTTRMERHARKRRRRRSLRLLVGGLAAVLLAGAFVLDNAEWLLAGSVELTATSEGSILVEDPLASRAVAPTPSVVSGPVADADATAPTASPDDGIGSEEPYPSILEAEATPFLSDEALAGEDAFPSSPEPSPTPESTPMPLLMAGEVFTLENGGGVHMDYTVRDIDEEALTGTVSVRRCEGAVTGELAIPDRVLYQGYDFIVTHIEAKGFVEQEGDNITALSLPDGVTHIGRRAFAGAGIAGELILPEDLESIGAGAFVDNAFTAVESQMTVLSKVHWNAFEGLHPLPLDCPDELAPAYRALGFYYINGAEDGIMPSLSVDIRRAKTGETFILRIDLDCALRGTDVPTAESLVVSGGTVESFTLQSTRFPASATARILPDGSGPITVSLEAGAYRDCYHTGNRAAAPLTMPLGLTPGFIRVPTVANQGDALTIGLSLGGRITPALDGTFLQVEGGVLESFRHIIGSGIATLVILPTGGDLRVDIPDDAYRTSDGSGNFSASLTVPQGPLVFYKGDDPPGIHVRAANMRLPSGDLIVPATVRQGGKDLPVVAVADQGFYNCDRITSLTLPEGLRQIGLNAFYSCDYLRDISLPASLSSMERSFGSCRRVRSLSAAMTDISGFSSNAFYGLERTALECPPALADTYRYERGFTDVNGVDSGLRPVITTEADDARSDTPVRLTIFLARRQGRDRLQAEDIEIIGGTLRSFEQGRLDSDADEQLGADLYFQAELMPDGQSDLRVTIGAGAYVDMFGEENLASDPLVLPFLRPDPTVFSLATIPQQLGSGGGTIDLLVTGRDLGHAVSLAVSVNGQQLQILAVEGETRAGATFTLPQNITPNPRTYAFTVLLDDVPTNHVRTVTVAAAGNPEADADETPEYRYIHCYNMEGTAHSIAPVWAPDENGMLSAKLPGGVWYGIEISLRLLEEYAEADETDKGALLLSGGGHEARIPFRLLEAAETAEGGDIPADALWLADLAEILDALRGAGGTLETRNLRLRLEVDVETGEIGADIVQ